jgi:FMN phosphatase YigB (HAD superfamily)
MEIDNLTGLLDLELFSDEVGIRKPNPDLMLAAVKKLGVTAQNSWFIGDKLNRDILGARRAGLGKAILMSSAAGPGQPVRGVAPDAVIDSLTELLSLIN